MDGLRVIMWNAQGHTVYNGGIFAIPVNGDIVDEKGMELYFKRNLCPMRRAALVKSLQEELFNAMKAAGGIDCRAEWSALPETIRSYSFADEDIKWYKLYY